MTSLVKEHGRLCMPCAAKFSMTLQTKILSTVTSDFLEQMIISCVICTYMFQFFFSLRDILIGLIVTISGFQLDG